VLPPLLFSASGTDSAPLADCYGLACHQIPDRSFFAGSVQFSLCSRCVGFFGALLVTSLALALAPRKPELPLSWALLLIMPGLVDVALDLSAACRSANLIRLVSGFAAGLGSTAYLYPRYLSRICQ
jgi:uncharacterized membrane protein